MKALKVVIPAALPQEKYPKFIPDQLLRQMPHVSTLELELQVPGFDDAGIRSTSKSAGTGVFSEDGFGGLLEILCTSEACLS